MKIEIAPGCFVKLTENEKDLAEQVRNNTFILQENLSSSEIPHILSLIHKNILKRRNQSGRVRYEVRSGVNW